MAFRNPFRKTQELDLPQGGSSNIEATKLRATRKGISRTLGLHSSKKDSAQVLLYIVSETSSKGADPVSADEIRDATRIKQARLTEVLNLLLSKGLIARA